MKTEVIVLITLSIGYVFANDEFGCPENQVLVRPGRRWCDQVCNSKVPICICGDSKVCVCKRGFQRLTNDLIAPCVRPDECVKCGNNQEFQLCGSACPRYCGMPKNVACVLMCVQGCFCKPPYVLRSKDSKECILESECPKYA